MSAQKILDQMSAIVEQCKAKGLLSAYEDDFRVHDTRNIRDHWLPQSRFIWVITPNGTHLTEIGIHASGNEWAEATINCGYENKALYLIADGRVKPLTYQQAMAEAKRLNFTVVDSCIMDKSGTVAAHMHLKPVRTETTQGGEVRFSLPEGGRYTDWLKHVLKNIALREVSRYYRSWFVSLDEIVFDGA